MESKRNRIRSLNDILRDQLDLLAEQSELEGDGGNLAAISHEMVNIYQALTSSESKAQKQDSNLNVEMVTEIVMDVVGRIEEARTENSPHTQHENKGTDNSYLIDISRMIRDAIERHQSRQEKAATDAAVTADITNQVPAIGRVSSSGIDILLKNAQSRCGRRS